MCVIFDQKPLIWALSSYKCLGPFFVIIISKGFFKQYIFFAIHFIKKKGFSSFCFDAWCVDYVLFLYVSYSIQYCFIKVFLKALIVCIFYEHFVFHVYTFSRFIWCNKWAHTNVYLLVMLLISLISYKDEQLNFHN